MTSSMLNLRPLILASVLFWYSTSALNLGVIKEKE